jgi:hypothetical protein
VVADPIETTTKSPDDLEALIQTTRRAIQSNHVSET